MLQFIFFLLLITLSLIKADILPPIQMKNLIDNLYSDVRAYLLEESEAEAITEEGGIQRMEKLYLKGSKSL
jgi:hypothetical protein